MFIYVYMYIYIYIYIYVYIQIYAHRRSMPPALSSRASFHLSISKVIAWSAVLRMDWWRRDWVGSMETHQVLIGVSFYCLPVVTRGFRRFYFRFSRWEETHVSNNHLRFCLRWTEEMKEFGLTFRILYSSSPSPSLSSSSSSFPHTYLPTHAPSYIHRHIHTYMHGLCTYIHTYIHNYAYIHIHT